MGRQGYSVEFRRKVLDLLAEGRSVASVGHDLGISDQTIYNWRRQDRIDRGLQSGLSTFENAELAAAKKRISELETELAICRRSIELLQEESSPKAGSRPLRWWPRTSSRSRSRAESWASRNPATTSTGRGRRRSGRSGTRC